MKKWQILTVLVVMVGVAGCIPISVPDVKESMAASDYLPAPQPERSNTLIGKETLVPYRPTSTQQRYTLSMVDMDLREAVAALSRLSDVPIVAEPNVTGTVNLVVENQTVSEILMSMIRPLGYSAYVDHNVILVAEPRMITRAFFLNYLKDKRTSSSVTNASISSGSGSGTSGTSSGSGGDQGNVTVTTSGDSDFWEELLKGLQLLVFGGSGKNTGDTGKRIVVNDMSGVVYVTDTEENIALVSAFLADVEKELKRQVLIQAHIVEIDLDKDFSMGINWSNILGSNDLKASQRLFAPTSELALASSALPGNVFSLKLDANDFSVLLEAFKEQGHVNMLSSPKISTMNNQKAVIKLTTKEVTWIKQETFRGDSAATSTVTSTPQIDEVGLFLDVTPNIDGEGVVTMHVHPSISEIKSVSVSPDDSSSKPIISVREVDTIVEARSGQTVVIAGLIVDRTREVKRSVPGLGDIPYLGLAFSNFQQETKKTELVIFLTPFVLEQQTIEEVRQKHEQRLLELDEISRFIESRSWQGWRTLDAGSRSPNAGVYNVQKDPVAEAVTNPEPLPVDQGAALVQEPGKDIPPGKTATSNKVIPWSTPQPRR